MTLNDTGGFAVAGLGVPSKHISLQCLQGSRLICPLVPLDQHYRPWRPKPSASGSSPRCSAPMACRPSRICRPGRTSANFACRPSTSSIGTAAGCWNDPQWASGGARFRGLRRSQSGPAACKPWRCWLRVSTRACHGPSPSASTRLSPTGLAPFALQRLHRPGPRPMRSRHPLARGSKPPAQGPSVLYRRHALTLWSHRQLPNPDLERARSVPATASRPNPEPRKTQRPRRRAGRR